MNFKRFSTSDNQWHDISYYQHKTATDTLTLPATLYPNDTSITVGIKGNTTQSGTPSPQNPVMPNGVGVRTKNSFNINGTYTTHGSNSVSNNQINAKCAGSNESYIWFDDTIISGTYKLSLQFNDGLRNVRILCSKAFSGGTYNSYYGGWYAILDNGEITITVSEDFKIGFNFIGDAGATGAVYYIMLSTDTNADYEPYGYKIPISSANTTTSIYLGGVETTRKIRKLVLTGEESWDSVSGNAPYRISLSTIMETTDRTAVFFMCSHFLAVSNDTSWSHYDSCISVSFSGDGINIKALQFRYTAVSSLDDFKSYLAAQYAAGTPVTVWYVLANEETGIVNEPLMKIGNYADEVSGITVPVTVGGDIISVDTTVQPSGVAINYKGWHNAKCKEYSYNMTIADWESASISQMENHTIQELQGGNWV